MRSLSRKRYRCRSADSRRADVRAASPAALSPAMYACNVALSAADLITETPGRFVLATRDIAALQQRADRAGVPILILGQAGGSRVSVGTALAVDVTDVVQRRSSALENSLQAAK